jgi:23S rRNA (uracil1939-C5)-methyltransferase
MKIQDPNITNVISLSHDGRGIAKVNGKTLFLSGALPNETVRFRYLNRHSKFDEGIVVEVITPAINRVIPFCPYFGTCGGCSAQHISTTDQIQHKEKVLLELLHHQARVTPKKILPPLVGPTIQYRRKARFSVKYTAHSNKILLGFYEVNGRYITEMDDCKILDSRIANKIPALKQLLSEMDAKKYISQLEISVADNTTAIVLQHSQRLDVRDRSLLENFAKQHHLQFFLQFGSNESISPIYPNNPEPLFYQLKNHDLTLHFLPTQFIQVNGVMNEQLIDRAITLLKPQSTDKILDLFCGIGNFTLPIAKLCEQIDGVDLENESILAAVKNAEFNKITNARFYQKDLFREQGFQPLSKHYDKLLIDPPRTGAENILKKMADWNPTRIVYVSCNPATLARDSKTLIQMGYHLTAAGVQDMFPHTKHVEAIALFEK